MTFGHDTPRPSKRVGEPAQVYLTSSDQARLDRLTVKLHASKSDVLRRGLEAPELQNLDPAAHPALKLIGLVDDGDGVESFDVARVHDQVLADAEEQSWNGETPSGGRDG